MNVNHKLTQKLDDSHMIEIGGSTWNPEETSIRRRYDNPDSGTFSPHGSSELPVCAIEDIVRVACENDLFDADTCAAMLSHLSASIQRIK